jgi:hypothetical protein
MFRFFIFLGLVCTFLIAEISLQEVTSSDVCGVPYEGMGMGLIAGGKKIQRGQFPW